ncbi:MAG: hypothetical protein HOQ18_18390 [Dermatophilaceae bacterium]|nr:hypothetical protein [Dermatophilaceae bacterium]NUO92771.1 hypothetical protein [Dermatophilaceae bacterium]
MSVRPEKSWSLWCDWPGCDYQFEDGDYSIFGDGHDAEEIVTEADGRIDRDGKRHYCHNHPATWASDHENGEPFPAPPYLLIHDGDTGNPLDDDGRVSLIGGAE